jgi:mannose-6-phosphate isomerase-like protein (cupin superfamily)
MLLKSFDEIDSQDVDLPGMEGVSTQSVFIDDEMLPGFHVRMFSLKPKGRTGLHWHRRQHEHYIVAGEGFFVGKDDVKTCIRGGQVIVVPSLDSHSIVNPSDSAVLRCGGGLWLRSGLAATSTERTSVASTPLRSSVA